jgi:hypothetical protein
MSNCLSVPDPCNLLIKSKIYDAKLISAVFRLQFKINPNRLRRTRGNTSCRMTVSIKQ